MVSCTALGIARTGSSRSLTDLKQLRGQRAPARRARIMRRVMSSTLPDCGVPAAHGACCGGEMCCPACSEFGPRWHPTRATAPGAAACNLIHSQSVTKHLSHLCTEHGGDRRLHRETHRRVYLARGKIRCALSHLAGCCLEQRLSCKNSCGVQTAAKACTGVTKGLAWGSRRTTNCCPQAAGWRVHQQTCSSYCAACARSFCLS
jgi:hypothetical protein